MKIKTRFAPSPTGYLHVGGARTALYSWLFARNHGGEFVLRIEDTDLERSTPEAIEAIMDGMNWLSLEWDEGPYYQTKRFDRYNAVIDQMLEEGTAYKCYCSKERLEALRREIATAQEDLDKRKAEWQNEKDAIEHVQNLKSDLEGAQLEEERATREGDLVKASEIRYARIPALQQQLHAAEEELNVKQQDGAILKEEVSDDEIAEVVSTWTGIPVQKMMQGEMAKLVDLEDKLHERVVGQDEAVSSVARRHPPQPRWVVRPEPPHRLVFVLGPRAWARRSSRRRWPSTCSTARRPWCASTCPSTWRSSRCSA